MLPAFAVPPSPPAFAVSPSPPSPPHKLLIVVLSDRWRLDYRIVIVILRHSRRAVASCMPPSPLCRIFHPAPPLFVVLLCPTCSVGCPVARWPPSASQPAPSPLFTPLHLLVVMLRCVASHCLAPWPSLPLSSCLRLSLRPSCLAGCRVVLPGAPASLPLLSPCSKCRCRHHRHRCRQ